MKTRIEKDLENLDIRRYIHKAIEYYMNEYEKIERYDKINLEATLEKCTTLTNACLILRDYHEIISKGGE